MFLTAMSEIDDLKARVDATEAFDAHCEWALEASKGCNVKGTKEKLQEETPLRERIRGSKGRGVQRADETLSMSRM